MSKVKLTAAQDKFLRAAAFMVANGNWGHSASSQNPTTKALLKLGLVEAGHRPLWAQLPRWRPTAAGYAWLGLEPPHE